MPPLGHINLWYAGFCRWVIRACPVKDGPGDKFAAISSARVSWHRAFVKLQKCHMAGLRLHKSPIPRTHKVASEHCKSLLAAANPVGLNKDSNYSIPCLILSSPPRRPPSRRQRLRSRSPPRRPAPSRRQPLRCHMWKTSVDRKPLRSHMWTSAVSRQSSRRSTAQR